MRSFFYLLGVMLIFSACKKEPTAPVDAPRLIIKIAVDENQERLGNRGLPVTIPAANAAQNPVFNTISGHYLELAPEPHTLLGDGAVLHHAIETEVGGSKAIDFAQSIRIKPGDTWLDMPLSDLPIGTYKWARLSLSYQNYDLAFHYAGQPYTGTLASFVGYNQYISAFDIDGTSVAVNENKLQGYWAFKSIGGVVSGQASAGATTVPNPLFNTSPIPAGSCVVTGEFSQPLLRTGTESEDIVLTLSLSVNQSFEWEDKNGNGKWDVDANADEKVVDMGVRGLVPSYAK